MRSLSNLIRDGTAFEDDLPRPIHHFFDPATGTGLAVPGAEASPDWALDATVLNGYSRRNLTGFMYDAYVQPLKSKRNEATGLMFETIGRLIHHLQDMAAPQHVRNDAHLSFQTFEDRCPPPPRPLLDDPVCAVYRALSAPSGYEAWTLGLPIASLPTTGYAPVYGPDDPTTFSDPRRFWLYEGKGMAEFANRNFFSAGTMNRTPPVAGAPFDMLASSLCAGAQPPCQVQDLDYSVRFFPTVVEDRLRPAAGGPNPYAAAESIYSYDFNRITGGAPVRTVNRFTFAYDHAYLLPRAVGYSAGFINYLFRGELKIAPPAEGVYAVVDTTAIGCGSPCGFRKVKLKLQNTTPGNEVMGPGTLRAVVRFYRNQCYRPDLSGMYGGPSDVFLGESCRSAEESIAVSAPTADTTVSRADGGALYQFDFSATPIPIEATDVRLQVVFRGRLGQEDDAVAATTVDIAEPNFLAVANITDYAFDSATNKYVTAAEGGQLPALIPDMRMGFADPATVLPVATLAGLSAGEHAQFAILADTTGVRFWLRTASAYDWEEGEDIEIDEFVLREELASDRYRLDCPVIEQRGMYRQWSRHFAQQVRAPRVASEAKSLAKNGIVQKEGAICYARPDPGTGGLSDLSAMTPLFSPTTARRWSINF